MRPCWLRSFRWVRVWGLAAFNEDDMHLYAANTVTGETRVVSDLSDPLQGSVIGLDSCSAGVVADSENRVVYVAENSSVYAIHAVDMASGHRVIIGQTP